MADSVSRPGKRATPVFSFPPVVSSGARFLILGSMPGMRSLEAQQYYAHPRNAFWPIMDALLAISCNLPYEERCRKLKEQSVALWDVMQACVRPGSLDACIDPATIVPNDLGSFLNKYPSIEKICFNGGAAADAYRRHVIPKLDLSLRRLPRVQLPSTSPAHASKSLSEKITLWKLHLSSDQGRIQG